MNSYYIINLLIYAAVDAMACLGLNQQFGVAGVTNFGFIIFQAAGGYTAAILALPNQSANGGFQSYIGGWNLPFPLPWIGAAVVGGLIALPFTFLVGRRLRGDFAAVGLLVTAVLLNLLATNYRPLLNGDAGLSLIPQPLQGSSSTRSRPATSGPSPRVAIVVCALVYLFVRRITESPYGRSLRAMRDNDLVADSLGKNLLSLRTAMLVTGGAIAGLSGGILVSYITHLVAGGVGLRGDRGAVRGGDHRRGRQPPRRHPRGDPGAGRLRGGHPLHPHLEQPSPEPDPVAGVGGDRAADRGVPVGAAAGHPAGAQAGDQDRRAVTGGTAGGGHPGHPASGERRAPGFRRGRPPCPRRPCRPVAVRACRHVRRGLPPALPGPRSSWRPSTCHASSGECGRSTGFPSASGAAR